MKKKLLAALLAVLALAIAAVTVFAADTPAYTVDENGNITLDVVINLIGDINGDGNISAVDKKLVYSHISQSKVITDEYIFNVADVNGDGKITAVDKKLIYNHINGTKPLW